MAVSLHTGLSSPPPAPPGAIARPCWPQFLLSCSRRTGSHGGTQTCGQVRGSPGPGDPRTWVFRFVIVRTMPALQGPQAQLGGRSASWSRHGSLPAVTRSMSLKLAGSQFPRVPPEGLSISLRGL